MTVLDDLLITAPRRPKTPPPAPAVVEPTPERDNSRVEALLESIRETLANLRLSEPPPNPTADGRGDAIELVVEAINNVPTGASADDIAAAIASRLPSWEPPAPADLSVLDRLADSLQTLDFRLKGIGAGSGGGGSVNFSQQALASLADLAGGGASGGLTDDELRAAPVDVIVTGGATGLTDDELRATPVPVSGTVSVTEPVTIDGTVALDAGTLAALETVSITGTVTVDSELTTKDFDSGAGTENVAVTGLVVPASGGSAAITGDAANGLDVDVTRLPALVAGTAVIGKVGIDQTTPGTTNLVALAANQSVNLAQVNAGTTVASVTGVQDVMPRKRTGSTGLSPIYYSVRLAAKATTTVTSSTAYLQCVVITTSNAGNAMSITLQDKQGTAVIMYTVTSAVVGTITIPFSEPVVMTSGIDIVIGGTTAGVVNIFLTYWQ